MYIFLSQFQQTRGYGEIQIFVIFKLKIFNFHQISPCMIPSKILLLCINRIYFLFPKPYSYSSIIYCSVSYRAQFCVLSNQLRNVRIVHWKICYHIHKYSLPQSEATHELGRFLFINCWYNSFKESMNSDGANYILSL